MKKETKNEPTKAPTMKLTRRKQQVKQNGAKKENEKGGEV